MNITKTSSSCKGARSNSSQSSIFNQNDGHHDRTERNFFDQGFSSFSNIVETMILREHYQLAEVDASWQK